MNEQHSARPTDPKAYQLESWRQALRVLQEMNAHERKKHFDMLGWGHRSPCGTIACIAGHCSLDPWFRENRPFRSRWSGQRLSMFDCDFDETFGVSDWFRIFYSQGDHAEAVRAVTLLIAQATARPVSPLGWGMP